MKLTYVYFFHRHLVNDGVEETPPHTPPADSGSEAEGGEVGGDDEINNNNNNNLFVDLSAANANVGFHHWHPEAVTSRGGQLAGQGEMGGVWEWTSSPLRRHEGFEPMALYPAYTCEFLSRPPLPPLFILFTPVCCVMC